MTSEERNIIVAGLVRRIKESYDEKALLDLYNHCKNYFEAYYTSVYKHNGIQTSYDRQLLQDLKQDLYFYMLKAISAYSEGNAAFTTYLTNYFKTILYREKRKYDTVHFPDRIKEKGKYEGVFDSIFFENYKNKGEDKYELFLIKELIKNKLECLDEKESIAIKLKYRIIDVLPETITGNLIAKYMYENGYTKKLLQGDTITKFIKIAENKLGITPQEKEMLSYKESRQQYYLKHKAEILYKAEKYRRKRKNEQNGAK